MWPPRMRSSAGYVAPVNSTIGEEVSKALYGIGESYRVHPISVELKHNLSYCRSISYRGNHDEL